MKARGEVVAGEKGKNESRLYVRRSDGVMIPFDREYIVQSLVKETRLARILFGVEPMSREEAEFIAQEVEKEIKRMKLKFLSGPLIRELVCVKLLEHGYHIYRNVYTRVGCPLYEVYEIDRGTGFEARENANLQLNPETFHKKKADRMCKEAYLLMMPPYMADAHLKGDIHIHDLEYFFTRPFCQDHDLRFFFYYGLMPDGTGTHTAVAGPAKHPEVAILHAAKVLGSAQVNFSGGQGFFNFTVFLAPYLQGLSKRRIRQLAQMFLYEMMQAYVARGGQPVFSSIQIEAGVPKVWREAPVVYAGKIWKGLTYGDLEEEVKTFALSLLEEYIKGDYKGKMFNFPKPEVVQRRDYWTKSEYEEIMYKAAELSAKFGSTYYDNVIPPYRGGEDGVSCYQCCAYSFSEGPESEDFWDKVYFVDGAHFAMGGLQVITINMPRLAYKAKGDDDKLFEELERVMEIARDVLLYKYNVMKRQYEAGLIPFASQKPKGSKYPLVDLDELVLTIGVVGVNEMVQCHTGYQLHEHREAVRFALRTIIEMERIKEEFEKETGRKFAIARTPAESCAQRLAVCDLIHYREYAIKYAKGDVKAACEKIKYTRDLPVYYTNGTHVNVSAKIPLWARLDIEQKFFPILSGGNIFHIWLGEANPDPEAIFKLNKKIALNTWIGYWSYTKDLTVCRSCDYTIGGLLDKCPRCGSVAVSWYSRITGYYQEVSGWNEGKKQELRDRYRIRIS